MQIKLNFKLLLLLFISLIVVLVAKNYLSTPESTNNTQTTQAEELKIISTNPTPLEGATILPTQYIEITFNKPIVKSEFKHKFDQDVEYELQAVDMIGPNKDISKTFKFIFKKPLELSQGYTLTILSNTHTDDGLNLKQDHSFTFTTVKYRGV